MAVPQHQVRLGPYRGHEDRLQAVCHPSRPQSEGSHPAHDATHRKHDGRGVFAGLEQQIVAGRYHSLTVAAEPWPQELEISARAVDDGTIMGLRHREFPIHGVQFHPESVLTSVGRRILRNFLEV